MLFNSWAHILILGLVAFLVDKGEWLNQEMSCGFGKASMGTAQICDWPLASLHLPGSFLVVGLLAVLRLPSLVVS